MAWETIAAAARIMAISAGDFTIRTQETSRLGVDEMGVGKAASELRVGSGGVVPAVELNPDASAPPPALRELGGEEGGWVELGGIDVGLRIGNDAVRGQEGGDRGARRVHGAADPERLFTLVHDHDELVHVEGPAVITGKIVQARRIGGA
jgi:hypothetical protein